jgi:hypothetical protein
MLRCSRQSFALYLCVSFSFCAACGEASDRSDAGRDSGPDAAVEDSGTDVSYDAGPSGPGSNRPWDHADPCAAIDCPPDSMCVGQRCVPIGSSGTGGNSGFGGLSGHGGIGGFGGRPNE